VECRHRHGHYFYTTSDDGLASLPSSHPRSLGISSAGSPKSNIGGAENPWRRNGAACWHPERHSRLAFAAGVTAWFAVGSELKFSARHGSIIVAGSRITRNGNDMESFLTKVQKLIVITLAALLILVVVLSTIHLGILIAEEIWKTPRFLIPVQGLLEIFSFFLLVLIGVELLETLKAYVKKDAIPVRLVLEVALIAMARKVIIVEPDAVSGLTLLGIAAVILALGVAFYFERLVQKEQWPAHRPEPPVE
jgi:uncharacterized membrane protein (DUF373 family)